MAASPECTPASSMCSMIPPITYVLPSPTRSTSTSTASSRNRSTSSGRSGETQAARGHVALRGSRRRRRSPSPVRRARSSAAPARGSRCPGRWRAPPRRSRPIPFAGCRRPSCSTSSENLLLSSARSIESGLVPMIGTPARSRPTARLSGVWPPSCTMTPSGLSRSTMASTSSWVSGSKYSLSEVSKSVETVSGLELTMMVSKPDLAQGEGRVHAAVVELDALPDAVGPAAEDHDLPPVRRPALVLPPLGTASRSSSSSTAWRPRTPRRRCPRACTTGSMPCCFAQRAHAPPSAARAARRSARR